MTSRRRKQRDRKARPPHQANGRTETPVAKEAAETVKVKPEPLPVLDCERRLRGWGRPLPAKDQEAYKKIQQIAAIDPYPSDDRFDDLILQYAEQAYSERLADSKERTSQRLALLRLQAGVFAGLLAALQISSGGTDAPPTTRLIPTSTLPWTQWALWWARSISDWLPIPAFLTLAAAIALMLRAVKSEYCHRRPMVENLVRDAEIEPRLKLYVARSLGLTVIADNYDAEDTAYFEKWSIMLTIAGLLIAAFAAAV